MNIICELHDNFGINISYLFYGFFFPHHFLFFHLFSFTYLQRDKGLFPNITIFLSNSQWGLNAYAVAVDILCGFQLLKYLIEGLFSRLT